MASRQQHSTRAPAQRIVGRRVAARAVDVVIAAVGSIFFFYVGVTIYITGIADEECVVDLCGTSDNPALQLAGLSLMFVSLTFPLVYELVTLALSHSTPGKALMGLRILTTMGARAQYGRLAWRSAVMWVPPIVFTAFAGAAAGSFVAVLMWMGAVGALLLMLGYVLTGAAPLHDRKAQTRVVGRA